MKKPIRGNVPVALTDEQIVELREIYEKIRQIPPGHAYSMLCLADTTEEERRFFSAVGDLNTYGRPFAEEQAELEDRMDAAVAEEAYAEYVASGCEATPIDELWKELGLDDDDEVDEKLQEAEREAELTDQRYI